ncbi:hypothetical protein [Streptomyces sp. NPDC001927]
MAMSHARKAFTLGTSGIVAAATGAMLLTSGAQAAPQTAPRAEVATEMPVAVENFSYPGADKILQEQRITLKRGDGHITLVPCTGPWDINIDSRLVYGGFCFKVTSDTGWLTLEIPDAFSMTTDDHAVKATINAGGEQTVFNVPANSLGTFGEAGNNGERSVLVELRITG